MTTPSAPLVKTASTSCWQRSSVFAAVLVWFCLVASIWNATSFDTPINPENHDGIFYENIARSISQGAGFEVNFIDDDWVDHYKRLNESREWQGRYDWVLRYREQGPTAMRSPAYPMVVAGVYYVSGWRNDAVRMTGLLLTASGLAFLAVWIWARWGVFATTLFCLTMSIDYSVLRCCGVVSTEPLAILVAALTFLSLINAFERSSWQAWVIAGAAFGLLTLTRGNWNLALLIVIIGMPILAFRSIRSWLPPHTVCHWAVFLIACATVAAPWWIRNCLVTRHFQPFGTAGSQGLVAAYCDESFEDNGNFQSDVFRQHHRAFYEAHDLAGLSLAEREFWMGQDSTSHAFEWTQTNWTSLPQLAAMRYLSHWGFTNRSIPWFAQIGNGALLLFGLLGIFLASGNTRKVLLTVFILDAVVVMLTWAHYGRYAIPIRPLVHLSYAIFWAVCFKDLHRRITNRQPAGKLAETSDHAKPA